MGSEQQTVRERIAKVVDEYGAWPGNTDPAVSEILAIVREAMKGEKVVSLIRPTGYDFMDRLDEALDTAFGADDDEGES